jgi:copper chaperone CopZ
VKPDNPGKFHPFENGDTMMEMLFSLLLFAGAFFLMMRFGCGAHSGGHGGKSAGGCCGGGHAKSDTPPAASGHMTQTFDASSQPHGNPDPEKGHARMSIEGMSCSSCVSRIEKALSKASGVVSASVDFAAATADVAYQPAIVSADQLLNVVKQSGYDAALAVSIEGTSGR